MSKMKNESYFTIEGWMGNELGLKYSLQKVYAVIYSFSKDGKGEFTGSWSYLASCMGGASRPTINTALKTLVDRGYVVRRDEMVNGQNRPRYRVNPVVEIFNGDGKIFYVPMVKKFSRAGEKNLLDTIAYTATFDSSIHNIVEYLNTKAGTKYRSTTESTRKAIASRLLEGFTCEDFYTVINKKVSEWRGSDMEKYLCPSTLFGLKFENYLNAPLIKPHTPKADTAMSSFETDDFFELALRRSCESYSNQQQADGDEPNT